MSQINTKIRDDFSDLGIFRGTLYIQITVEHDYLLNYCLPEYLLKILLYMNFLFRNIYECVKGAARAMSVAAR